MNHLCSVSMFSSVISKKSRPIIRFFPIESKTEAKSYYENTLSLNPCPSFIFETPIPYKSQGQAKIIEAYGFKSYKKSMHNIILTLERIGLEVKNRFSNFKIIKTPSEDINKTLPKMKVLGWSLYFSLLEDLHASNFSEEIDEPQQIFEEIALGSGAASLFCLKLVGNSLRVYRIASSGFWHKEVSKVLEDILLQFVERGYFSF
jgi:hypothetical protein